MAPDERGTADCPEAESRLAVPFVMGCVAGQEWVLRSALVNWD
jgi:hypothetical protein